MTTDAERYRTNCMYLALKVITKTPAITKALAEVDPMALKQALRAVRIFERAREDSERITR